MRKVLLDEGLSLLAAELLRQHGIDALHAQEAGLLAASDQELIRFARAQQRVIFTLDHDYHQLLALSGERDLSVVLFRFEHLKAREAARMIKTILETYEADLTAGVAVSVSPSGVRLRRLP